VAQLYEAAETAPSFIGFYCFLWFTCLAVETAVWVQKTISDSSSMMQLYSSADATVCLYLLAAVMMTAIA